MYILLTGDQEKISYEFLYQIKLNYTCKKLEEQEEFNVSFYNNDSTLERFSKPNKNSNLVSVY